MKITQLALGVSALFFVSLNTVSADDDPSRVKQSRIAKSTIVKMAKAMGGLDKVNSLAMQQISASGSRWEPEQSFSPGSAAKHVGNFDYTLTRAFASNKSRTEWSLDILYPLVSQRSYTEIINGNYGAVLGVDTLIAPPQAPMLSTRIGARSKQHFVASPMALLKHALKFKDQAKYLGKDRFQGEKHRVLEIPAWDQPIRLYINNKTYLPSKAETLEDDSVYGDALWEVLFDQWAKVDGVQVPYRIVYRLNGKVINEETRNSVSFFDSSNDNLFVIPDELKTDLDQELFQWGIRSSQWFTRFIPAGIPFDLDQTKVEHVNLVEIAPKVFHARAFTHHTLIVEMEDFLVAVDPVLYEQRTQSVLQVAHNRWPNKPVKYIVASHFHNDHIGGIRGYAAEGATLIVGHNTEEHYEELLKASHAVYPDALALNPREVEIKTVEVDEDFIISDGARNIRIFDLANQHSTGMLVPYIEDAKMVFVSDLYNPELFTAPIPPVFSQWAPDLLAGLEQSALEIDWLAGAHGGVTSYENFLADVTGSGTP